MSNSDKPVPAKMNPLYRVVLGICGVIGIFFGVSKMREGINQIRGVGADSVAVQQLFDEAKKALDAGNAASLAAQPRFQAMLDEVDKIGLDTFRAQKEVEANDVSKQFGEAATQFRTATKKFDEMLTHDIKENHAAFFKKQSEALKLYAEAREKNQEIIRALLDKSIPTVDDLLKKIEPAMTSRDELQKAGTDADAEAAKLAEKLKT